MYTIYFTHDAVADFKKINKSVLKKKTQKLLDIIKNDPFFKPPAYKKLNAFYLNTYSRRINLQHRLFYEVDKINKTIKILRRWSNYGDN